VLLREDDIAVRKKQRGILYIVDEADDNANKDNALI
jgi:hypothetical protein